MHPDTDDLKAIVGYVLAGLVAIVAWFGKREVKRLDEQHADHDKRLNKLEDVVSNIMTAPQVLALYAEQREDAREKFKEMRQDHKELRAELAGRIDNQTTKIDRILERIENRKKNERAED